MVISPFTECGVVERLGSCVALPTKNVPTVDLWKVPSSYPWDVGNKNRLQCMVISLFTGCGVVERLGSCVALPTKNVPMVDVCKVPSFLPELSSLVGTAQVLQTYLKTNLRNASRLENLFSLSRLRHFTPSVTRLGDFWKFLVTKVAQI